MLKPFKLVPPLWVFILTLVAAIPAAADQPGLNVDPFGGFPILAGIGTPLCSFDNSCGEVFFKRMIVPGGVPSTKSGAGTSPRGAIYIGGKWGKSLDPASGESPPELPNCSTVKVVAGNARWFKMDTWKDRRIRIWLDDELDGSSQPSGSSVWSAADQYVLGTAPGNPWQINLFGDMQGPNSVGGFVMAIFGPENLRPNEMFKPPNATILTHDWDNGGLTSNGSSKNAVSYAPSSATVGYGSINPNISDHLLSYESRFDGWVYVLVYNQMIWDGFASVCSQRIK
jgi:hypothetical protein